MALVGPMGRGNTLARCERSGCVNPEHMTIRRAHRPGRGHLTDETGNRYNKLTVIGRATRGRRTLWLCRCDCGGERAVTGGQLRQGAVRSCGCTRTAPRTHGMARTRIYNIWHAMLRRCRNPNVADYPNYGGRGIRVCDRWQRFENFYADMGDRPEGKSLDRIDNNGNYEPGNVKWSDAKEQKANQRTSVVRMSSLAADAITRVSTSDKPTYTKAEVLSLLRVLRFNLVGE
jgi:hypothetical protein